MIERSVRHLFQPFFVDPLARVFVRYSIPPLFVTFLGLLLGLAIPFALFFSPLLALLLLIVSGYLDMLDGTMARLSDQSSPLGATLDILSDRAVEFAIVVGLATLDPTTRALPCLWMLGSILLCVTSFLVVGIFSPNSTSKSFHYSPGIIERAEAFLFFAAMIAFPPLFLPLAWTFTFLVFVTALIRVVEFSRSH